MAGDQRLEAISRQTLADYEERAESFWLGTRDHDVSQNIEAFLRPLGGDDKKLKLLDFGCAGGRDLLTFQKRGHDAEGVDGASRLDDGRRARDVEDDPDDDPGFGVMGRGSTLAPPTPFFARPRGVCGT